MCAYDWVLLRPCQHPQGCNMVRADILAGQKEQGSNSAVLLQRTLTLLQETKGDNQRWAIQLHHLQQDINILHAGGMKGNYSLRLAAVNDG